MSASSSATASNDANALVSAEELAASIALDAAQSLSLLHTSNAKKKCGADDVRQSGPEKVEAVYEAVDCIRSIATHLSDVNSYLEKVNDPNQTKLARECISFSMDEIGKQLDVISNALDNTEVKKRSKQVHAKLTKQERHEAKHKQFELQRMMTATPHQALRASLKNVKEQSLQRPLL